MSTTAVKKNKKTKVRGKPPMSTQNRWLLVILLGPALAFLVAFVVYPIIYSLYRSTFDSRGDGFVGIGNYVKVFTDPQTFTAFKNNIIWVLVAPLVCTILGLIFAVLMEKIAWATAFKLIIFMPMAISMLAAGIIFRTAFQQNPDIGMANAITVTIREFFSSGSHYPDARLRAGEEFSSFEQQETGGEILSTSEFGPGDVALIPLIGIAPEHMSDDPVPAVPSQAQDNAVTGTVWLDFIPGGGGETGHIDAGKPGLGGITIHATDGSGNDYEVVTADDGTFAFEEVTEPLTLSVPASNFTSGPTGINWLGPDLITPVMILAYVWIWAGFAMVMIGSGLSAIDRSLQEAARTDGASEWQVFRHITVPQLMPVIMVVIVTLMINVLKIFDLVYVIPPGSSKQEAEVLATRMWTVSFGGGNDQGLGSALAIVLLILVIPFMLINIRNFRRGGQR